MNALSDDAARFHNRLRILLNIEAEDFATAGLTFEQWRTFVADPFRAFIRADDATAAAIWSIVVKRDRGLWRDLNSAPEDEAVLLATEGKWVGEATMLRNQETGEPEWTWADCGRIQHIPLGWMPLPPSIDTHARG